METISPLIEPIIPPNYPIKPLEQRFFKSEQHFLSTLPRLLAPEIVHPPEQKKFLLSHITDLSSSQMAQEVMLAYGLEDGTPHSDTELAKKFQKSGHSIGADRRTVLQSLWLQYKDQFAPDLNIAIKPMTERYNSQTDQPTSTAEKRILKRAQANLDYYKDRQFINKHYDKEEETLALLEGMYGKSTKDDFARFYRLGEFKQSESLERRGNYPELFTTQEILHLVDILEAGRAVSEYIQGEKYGSHEWTNLRGKKIKGFHRKGRFFPTILKEFQRQLDVQVTLNSPDLEITPLQRELITLTTTARLNGRDKSEGLAEYNAKHGTKTALTIVKDIEDNILGQSEWNRLTRQQTKERLQKVLINPYLKTKLASRLVDVLGSYHVQRVSTKDIAEEQNIHIDRIGELKRFLDTFVLHKLNRYSGFLPKRGDITEADIVGVFPNNTLPEEITDLLVQMSTKDRLADVVQSENIKDVPLRLFALSSIRQIAEELAIEQEKRTQRE